MNSTPRAEIGVIGGSGFYSFLDDARTLSIDTPFGAPSDDVVIGEVAGRSVAFLARHGRDHRFPPHQVNYRANLWALRSVGVRQVLAPCAVGGLDPSFVPGTLVVPDQVVDRTRGRAHTVYDEPGAVVHVGFADPYCARGRNAVITAGHGQDDLPVVDSGTLVVINGPRFSSRAESQWHRSAGWSVVGMTGMPEAAIARELAMCFTSLCLVTDSDAGVEGDSGVTHEEVLAVFGTKIEHLKRLVREVITSLPAHEADESASCACRRTLDGLRLPFELP
ncbi:S-methyl-5'-thioadenosine phosphorylase [Yimella sp. cx-51]|uniref:S-methyl-5'-thioadenosine phosphorylase n=1 Tax=Yimella sp. cx-51 TaxID=2770551 RepID=UPI00165D37F7|nr:S-methyl-5'-thioadenosine phosphorylase [Yimella sp. cx-51]MBC9956213.1 S-methyl-5'-thioadenosine phosphorylase [Yimella sp. cx-51]QTH38640.1 S-methyl-5'-thioadenosine phosphorylase [Yimella sp. cx-51]